MKKLITICLLIATSFTVNAQDMSIEETVKYINDKIACCGVEKFNIKCDTSGNITWEYVFDSRINLFDLTPGIGLDNSVVTLSNSNGIILYNVIGKYWIDFQITEKTTKTFNWFPVQADAERVYKALQHLRSLCTKAKDPFDK